MSITIFMAGDSTAAHKQENKRPETGWFEKFYLYLSSNIKTKNFAFNGASTKTFLKKGLLDQIDHEIKAGDYLFIQFGHNDQKVEDPNWGTSITTYKNNLQKFVNVAKKHNAIPVILSSIVRRRFEGNKLINSLGKYPAAAQEIAKKNHIAFIDLNQITYNQLQKLGPEKGKSWFLNVDHSENYPDGVHDNTHLNPEGAKTIAGFAANSIKNSNLSLSKYIEI